MPLRTDHIIYIAPELEAACDRIEALLGIRPVFGGQHPGGGTHNALLALGNDAYLEVIAPDPAQPNPDRPRSFGLDKPGAFRLATWAVKAPQMATVVAAARARGYDPGEVVQGGRTRDDGLRLAWQSTKRPESISGATPPGDWLVPFLIDWGDTPHPSGAAPAGGTLGSLHAEHPNPGTVQAILRALDVDIEVREGPAIGLVAAIRTADGLVELR